MIDSRIFVSESLKKKLTPSHIQNLISECVKDVAEEALDNVQEYGLGVGSGQLEPFGGAPHWTGAITHEGHYSGYLSDSHRLKKVDNFNYQVVSSAEFVEGVIEGFSTNWQGVTFGHNYYHKRATDKIFMNNVIYTKWKKAIEGSL